MATALERLQKLLRQLPGLGHRSAERLALHLLVEKPERLAPLLEALGEASRAVRRCERCGHLAEDDRCAICADPSREARTVCVVEAIPDVIALERAGAYRGVYHVLHGRLSPIHGVGPEQLHLAPLLRRLAAGEIEELILALSNEVEAEATCHYVVQQIPASAGVKVSRIGFGLPSGGGLGYADSTTLRSALEARRTY